MGELAVQETLLDVRTGEVLDATPENAVGLLRALRDYSRGVREIIKHCETILVEESRRQGTKTLRFGGYEATVKGGSDLVWDVQELMDGLRDVGCPEDRINALVTQEVSYKVSAAVARQLEAANEDYASVIDRCRHRVEKPQYVTVSG